VEVPDEPLEVTGLSKTLLTTYITLVNKDSPKEKCLFLMYFWTLNSNMFPEVLYHPNLSLQVKKLESSEPGTKVCFNRWRYEEFKNRFSQEVGVVFWNDVFFFRYGISWP